MKRIIANIMLTSSATLAVLAVVFLQFNRQNIPVFTVFHAFGINILINIGIYLIQKIEFHYIFMEYILEICFINIILFIFGLILGWFTRIPIWIIPIMTIAIYVFVSIINTARTEKETQRINKLLQKLKEKSQ
jgi:hypothetical protein